MISTVVAVSVMKGVSPPLDHGKVRPQPAKLRRSRTNNVSSIQHKVTC